MPCPTRVLIRLTTIAVLSLFGGLLISWLLEKDQLEPLTASAVSPAIAAAAEIVSEEFEANWKLNAIDPTPYADKYTLARRLSLSLTGAPPSLEELKRLDELPTEDDPTQAWLDHLFKDRRYADYFAERLTRAFVGVEPGPFLIYRRRRLVNWLADEIEANRPYDELARSLIASKGVWTTHPEANFITVSSKQNGDDKGPDEIKLAARTSRAFLGISLDCMQCHDDKFGDRWKQEDFHQLAAFFAQSEISLTGVRDDPSINYRMQYRGEPEDTTVEASAPFSEELLSNSGSHRERLAGWITHPGNRPFSRAITNRVWALMLGRPLIEPVDDIPINGPFPPGLESLADAFTQSGFDLQFLIRTIAASEPFQLASSTDDLTHPVTEKQENYWAAFPVTPLRPEQVAGAIVQSGRLHMLGADTHIFQKLQKFGETKKFVERFGDPGESELIESAGTIPQRLLMMNGELVKQRTEPNAAMNSATRLARQSPSDISAIDTAFLCTLTRIPSAGEASHFAKVLAGTEGKVRDRAMEDIFWALINSTEFSWNR